MPHGWGSFFIKLIEGDVMSGGAGFAGKPGSYHVEEDSIKRYNERPQATGAKDWYDMIMSGQLSGKRSHNPSETAPELEEKAKE
jgi:hypothetical protein